MGKFKIVTPDGVGREYQTPDEGQLFKFDSSSNPTLGMIKNGQLLTFDPSVYIGQVNPEYNEVNEAVRNYKQVTNPFDPTSKQAATQYTLGGKTYTAAYDPKANSWSYYDKDWKKLGPAVVEGSMIGVMSGLLRAAGLGPVPTTGGERYNLGIKALGDIKISKIPQWNPADWQQATGATTGTLTPELLKSTYAAGKMAPKIDPATGGERILSAAETPPLISGEGGPKDAQGNLIPPSDYAKYGITGATTPTAAAPVTPAITPTGTSTIPFKAGLTDAQKASITQLAQKPTSQWTDTDRSNWAYATNNAPIPTTTPTTAPGAPTTTPTATGGFTADQITGLNAANARIQAGTANQTDRDNVAYAQGRGWTPTATPTARVAPTAPAAPVAPEAPSTITPTVPPTPVTTDAKKQAHDVCNNSNLPDDMKTMCNLMVDSADLTQLGLGFDSDIKTMIDTFNKIKTETIDPHFRELAGFYSQQIQDQYQATVKARELERAGEVSARTETVRGEKEALERAGLTFTGVGLRQLGAEAAYAPTAGAVIPGQEIPEGLVPAEQARIASSSQARYEESLKALGRGAEQYLGTTGAAGAVYPYTPVGGITGTLPTQKQAEYGGTLQDIMGQYLTRRQPLTT